MKRPILAFVAGLAVWIVVVSLLNRGLRFGFHGYAAAEPAMAFTLGMRWARLIIGALSSLAAGATASAIAPKSKRVTWLLGVFLLVAFLPEHIYIWTKFPLWYHLAFLVTLVPLVVLGGSIAQVRRQPA